MHTCGVKKCKSFFGDSKRFSVFTYKVPEKDKREMCKYCFNESPDRIIDPIDLAKYQEYYKGDNFKAFRCNLCSSTFHFREPKKEMVHMNILFLLTVMMVVNAITILPKQLLIPF